MNRYLDIARQLSHESDHKAQKMAAVVVRGGAIVSVGINRSGKCAEKRALRPHRDFEGADIYVARSNGRISRPCAKCQALLIKAGIRRAHYVALDGSIVQEVFRK